MHRHVKIEGGAEPSELEPGPPKSVEALAVELVREGRLDAFALERARKAAGATSDRLDLVLVKLGLISEDILAEAYGRFLGLPMFEAKADLPEGPILRDRLKFPYLKQNRIIPLSIVGRCLRLAIVDPFSDEPIRAVSHLLDAKVEVLVISPADFDRTLRLLYRRARDEPEDLQVLPLTAADGNEIDVQRLRDIANEAPVVRLVTQIIASAVEQGASDIHIEPQLDSILVRVRVDGFLRQDRLIAHSLRAALITRIKIMAKLDIAERRLPQDGRIKTAVRGNEIDIRVSTLPTSFGEGVVLRILDRTRLDLDLSKLGLSATAQQSLKRLSSLPNGIILVTGPTGSGKTTTLYATLQEVNRPDLKLFSVEDPIEYQLSGLNQIQVQPQIGLTFPTALRSILRQDPDVIMIGEIRDLETAQIAVQASLTGHLVLSTLHTNSALGAITRLIDIGIEPYLLSSTLAAVMAQRLVRKLCPLCSRPKMHCDDVTSRVLASLEPANRLCLTNIREPVGCDACDGSGYRGRTTVSELVNIDSAMRDTIGNGRDLRHVERLARDAGYLSLYQDGLMKVALGETSLEEILRVTRL